jgi:hypothetical protein
MVGDTLWVLTQQRAQRISLFELDMENTRELNADRGLEFPPEPVHDLIVLLNRGTHLWSAIRSPSQAPVGLSFVRPAEWHESVAGSVHRLQVNGVSRICFKFSPQQHNEIVNRSAIDSFSFGPDCSDKLLARKYTVWVVNEKFQNSELQSSSGNNLAGPTNNHLIEINYNVVE